MISVGIDIQRLGLMVVAGQPKNTAEYIQASSRVGRSAAGPGLVLTVYNWARPRDLSHYEHFENYHATFYNQVEPLSVTPFAERALDRSLAGLMVSLVRLAAEDFNPNEKARAFDSDNGIVTEAIERVIERVEKVLRSQEPGDRVRERLRSLCDEWKHRKDRMPQLSYRKTGGETVELLQRAGSEEWDDFTCLFSLRDVDQTSPLLFDDAPIP